MGNSGLSSFPFCGVLPNGDSPADVCASLAVSESVDLDEGFASFHPSDADRPLRRGASFIKSDDVARREFFEKTDYLASLPQYFPIDLVEIDCKEFIRWIFERDVRYKRDVVPFEDKMSKEYQIWLKQKKDGVKQIDYKGYSCWRYNPIIFYSRNKKGFHRVFLKEDNETLTFISGLKFALMSPITYVGRNNTSLNARYLYAFVFDLDGVGIKQIKKLFMMMIGGDVPTANIITNSGHGLHLYYILEEPVPLYEENIPLLNKLKHGLTNIIWNDHTSTIDDRQHQSIFQCFRLPGTLTKFGEKIRCFRNNESKTYTLEQLNGFLAQFKLKSEELDRLTKAPVYNPTGHTIEESKRLWPEWYASRVLNHKRVGKKWHVKRDVYDWWLNRLRLADKEIKVHHRYWCMLTLVIYAVKCDISREEVLNDAYSLVSKFDSYTEEEDNHFTTDDVDDAMKAYDENYNKWPISTIETTTTFRIDRNRRNGNHQAEHLMFARQRQEILRKVNNKGDWRGRKNKLAVVQEWRESHPNIDNKSLCARETGLERKTVIKWWDADKKANNVKTKKVKDPKDIIINITKLSAPNSTYTVDGLDLTTEELKELVTSGKAVSLGYTIIF